MTCHLLFLFKKTTEKKKNPEQKRGISTFLFRIYVGVLLIKFCMQCPYSRFKFGTDFVKMIFILERGTFWCTQSDPTRYAIGEFKLICFSYVIKNVHIIKCC